MGSQYGFDRVCRAGVAALIAAGLLTAAVQAAPQGSGSLEFMVDGQKVASDVWTFARFSKTDFNLTSNMHRDKRTLLLNLRNPQPGKPLALGSMSSGNYGTYYAAYGKQDTAYQITSGTVTFTELDMAKRTFSATFELSATGPSGSKVTISNGVVRNGKIGNDQLIN